MTQRIGLSLLFVFSIIFGLTSQVRALDNDPNDAPELFDSRYQTTVCGFIDLTRTTPNQSPRNKLPGTTRTRPVFQERLFSLN